MPLNPGEAEQAILLYETDPAYWERVLSEHPDADEWTSSAVAVASLVQKMRSAGQPEAEPNQIANVNKMVNADAAEAGNTGAEANTENAPVVAEASPSPEAESTPMLTTGTHPAGQAVAETGSHTGGKAETETALPVAADTQAEPKPAELKTEEDKTADAAGGSVANAEKSGQHLFQYFTGTLHELISQAMKSAQGLTKKVIAPISSRLRDDLAEKGVAVDTDYKHVIDNNAIRHAMKKHGGSSEVNRGQIPVTENDFNRIDDVVDNYDSIEVEQGKRKEINIIYSKTYADGTTIYVEEKRNNRKELAMVTMWKKKSSALTDANRVNTTPISDLREAVSTDKDTPSVAKKQEDTAGKDIDEAKIKAALEALKDTSKALGIRLAMKLSDKELAKAHEMAKDRRVLIQLEAVMESREEKRAADKIGQAVADAAKEVDVNPTEAQKEAGNYRKGHVRVDGMDISIEQPKGSVRRGTDADGKQWESVMHDTYGYIRGTEGVDGDHIDVFLSDHPDKGGIFVVDQVEPKTGKFDEHKVMYGYADEEEAKAAYLANYEKGWRGLGAITAVSREDFRKWVDSSRRKTKPFSEYSMVMKAAGLQSEGVQKGTSSLTDEEVASITGSMKAKATIAPRVEINDENWKDTVETPIGTVKMGENQKTKLFVKGGEHQYGMLLETLQNPDVVLEEEDAEQNTLHERPSSYLFVKTFKKEDGSKFVHFESVTVSQNGLEVSISSHIIRENQLKNKMKKDRLLFVATALDASANTSAEQPIVGGSHSSEGKGNEKISDEKEGNVVKYNGYLDGKTKLTASAIDRNLSKRINIGGAVKSIAEHIEGWHKDGGLKVEANEYMPEPNRRRWNSMYQDEQDAWEAAHSKPKTQYLTGDGKHMYELGKTAYDYAKWLLDSDAAAKQSAGEVKPLSDSGKIDDFGEKIGGARKDLARQRIDEAKKLTATDLKKIKDPDKILSRKQIIKYAQTGEVSNEQASRLLAANMAARTLGDGIELYRNLVVKWSEGGMVEVPHPSDEELREKTIAAMSDAVRSRYSEEALKSISVGRMPERLFEKAYNAYAETYKAIDYPTTDRKMGGAVIVRHDFDGRYWVLSKYGARRGWPCASLPEAVRRFKSAYPEAEKPASDEKKPKSGASKRGDHLQVVENKDWRGGYRIKSRVLPGNISLVGSLFPSRKAAEKYLDENREALADRERRLENALVGTNIGSAERKGKDWRGGRDVAPKDFLDKFGFRGVEFGNWVTQAERGEYLNKTYDAIMDFCELVGISPRAFSLNGRLGLAFGARGQGRALAHYEPGKEVINLTRTKGVGSLAHEWFHALDNYLARSKSGNVTDFATETGGTLRAETAKAFKDFVEVMARLDYASRSRRAGEYWAMKIECAARLFQCYIYNKAAESGIVSPLLSRRDLLAGEDEVSSGNDYPLPSPEENAQMKPYIDEIFDTLQERVDAETGNVALYHKTADGRVALPTAEERTLRDAVVDRLRESGLDVITDDAEGQRVLDEANGDVKMSAKKKRALETASLGETPRSLTVVSSADGAKILKNLDSLADDYEKSPNTKEKTFIGEVANSLGIEAKDKSSKYATFETKNGREDGKKNYVIFNEADAKITDRVRFFRTADGEAYGFTVGGKIYIDPRVAKADTPIHEYSHLWSAAMREANPGEWANIVELMRGTGLWDEVKSRYPELETDDDIADEVLAHYSGRRGAERLRAEQQRIIEGDGTVLETAAALSALERVRDALRRFWKGVADFLHIHFTTAEEVADRVLHDLLRGVDPRKYGKNGSDAVKFRKGGESHSSDELEAANERFNGELTRYKSGTMDKNEMLHLGKPQGVMRQFLSDLPIVMRQRILKKGSEKKHNVDIAALDDMPRHLSSPIFVFQRSDNTLGVLTEMQDRDGKNVCVAIELSRQIQDGGEMLEINDIRSIHGRNVADIVYPIVQNGTLRWVDKEKGLAYLSSASRYVQQEIEKQDLNTATKVIENFENPKSPEIEGTAADEMQEIVEAAKADGSYMKAPNGEPTELDEPQWAQVRTKAFKNWFGDWESDPENASKVVDEKGEPLVVFHGTPLSRSQITPNRGWHGDNYVEQEAPFYTFKGGAYSGLIFTSVEAVKARSIAEKRAQSIPDDAQGNEQWTDEGYVYILFVNTKKPFDPKNEKDVRAVLRLIGNDIPTLSFWGGRGENVTTEKAIKIASSERNSWLVTETPEFISKVKELGYDGLVGYDEGVKYIAVFSPNQLKDAYDNIGTFSTEQDNILLRSRKNGGDVSMRMGDRAGTFVARQKQAIEARGVVMPNLNEVSVKVVNDIPRHNYQGNIADATREAIDAAKQKYVGKVQTYNNYGEKFDYIISSNAIDICLSPKHQGKSVNKGVHLALAEHIDEIINNSIEVEEHPDYVKVGGKRDVTINGNALMHRFYGVAVIDGKPYRVMTLMREEKNSATSNGIHSYEVQKIEVLDNELPSTSNGVGSQSQSKIGSSYPLAKLLQGVEKAHDKGKKLLEESEKSSNRGREQSADGFAALPKAERKAAVGREAAAVDAELGTHTVVKDTAELDDAMRRAVEQGGGCAYYDPTTGETVVLADRALSAADVRASVVHENIGHKSLDALLGGKAGGFYHEVAQHIATSEELDALRKDYPGADGERLGSEWMAHLSETEAWKKRQKRA